MQDYILLKPRNINSLENVYTYMIFFLIMQLNTFIIFNLIFNMAEL